MEGDDADAEPLFSAEEGDDAMGMESGSDEGGDMIVDDEDDDLADVEEAEPPGPPQVWDPSRYELEEGEEVCERQNVRRSLLGTLFPLLFTHTWSRGAPAGL